MVELTKADRDFLEHVVERGDTPSRKVLHARILLLADQGPWGPALMDALIAERLGASAKTVGRVRERYTEVGLPRAIERKTHSSYKPRRLDREGERRLIALARQHPPEGHQRWTLRLLADRLVQLNVVEEISHETVRRQLQKSLGKAGLEVLSLGQQM